MEASVLVKALPINSRLYPWMHWSTYANIADWGSRLGTGDLSGVSFAFLTKVLCHCTIPGYCVQHLSCLAI